MIIPSPQLVSPRPSAHRWATLAWLVVAIVLAASGSPALAADAYQATEFSSGITPGCSITDITTGPDGNLWFAEYANEAIGRITTSGLATEFKLPYDPVRGGGGFPGGIAMGPDHNLWFVRRNGIVGRITPQGAITQFHDGITGFTTPVSQASLPNRIVAGPDGAMWFTEPAGVIGRITTDGQVIEYSDGIQSYPNSELGSLAGITLGPDGALWFADPQGQIGRITTAGQVTEFSAGISEGSVPADIVTGPDGNLWFTEFYGGRIARITPQGAVTEFSAGITPNSGPAGIARGPDGNLWFGERAGRIGRITPQGAVTEFPAGPNANPTAVTTGPDNAIWYSASDRIGRLAPGSETGGPAAGPGLTARPVLRLGALRGRRLIVIVSEPVILTARLGRHHLRDSLRKGRNSILLPTWLLRAARRGIKLTASDRAGETAQATFRIHPPR